MPRMKPDLRYSLLPVFAFAGAFLMFVLEPLVGRMMVPAYGGGFHVWTTCLMFFQGVLLLGYLYAHFIAPRIGRWHLLVACLPLLLLPIDVRPVPDPTAPIGSILVALLARVALPIGVLSTTGVVAQMWLARSERRDADPYWLYAASNAGSLLGLLAYPLLVDPLMGVASQRGIWSVLYLGYLGLVATVAPRGKLEAAPAAPSGDDGIGAGPAGRPVTRPLVLRWLALSMGPSVMLMAVTNAISFDVGSIPLVWVLPLALYLTTFILVFGKRQRYPTMVRTYWPELAIAGLVVLTAAPMFPSWPRLGIHLLALFAVCLAGHAELHRLRPAASELTKYYLIMSVGGWAGGVFVSIFAPVLFDRLFEYPVAIILVAGAILASRDGFTLRGLANTQIGMRAMVRAPFAVTGLAFAAAWMLPNEGPTDTRMELMRNHYGIYQVGDLEKNIGDEENPDVVPVRYLVHNGTMHGSQVVSDDLRHLPGAYYHRNSGLGDVLRMVGSPMKLGVIGLGTGGTAAYAGASDEIVFYEIDPDDETLAREHFTFLSDCPGTVRVVIGDARMMLAADARVPDGYFDALFVDAFSGDAIPTHLLTLEALELYQRKLRKGGIIVFNVTNRFYDLRPVLAAAAAELGVEGAFKIRKERDGLAPLESGTRYFVLSEDAAAVSRLVADGWTRVQSPRDVTVWTDDYVNVFTALFAQLRSGR